MSTINVFKLVVPEVEHSPLWAISSDYFSAKLVAAAKAVPGVHFEKRVGDRSNLWVGYPDGIAAVVARLKVAGISVEWESDQPAAESWKTARSTYLFSAKGLREYQVEGVRFLLARARDGALLADAMRLGKSLQATIAARAWKEKTLVVCPSHVVGVWGREPNAVEGPGEIAKWWPDAWKPRNGREGVGVTCLEGVKPWAASQVVRRLEKELHESGRLSDADTLRLRAARAEQLARAEALAACNVVICHYDVLYAWVDVLILWGASTGILDEAHILASHLSRRMEELKRLRKTLKRLIALTGTPLSNDVRKLFNVLDLICPGRFGYFFTPNAPDKATYARVFCESRQEVVGKGETQKTIWKHDGKSNLDVPDHHWTVTPEETLHARLQHFTLRRLKRDVDPQLPEKQRQIVDVQVPAKCMIGVGSHLFAGKGEELRRVLNLAADGKLKPVVALVADHIAEGEKVICYTYRRLFAEVVAREVAKKSPGALVSFVHGDLDRKERDKRAHAMQQHKGTGCLVCTVDSYSTGVDLSFSNVMVVAELTWEPHEMAQCLDAKTEILTPHGFVPIGTIRKGDPVAAFNTKTQELAYLPALKIIDRPLGASEQMFAIKGARLNLRVTGGHDMLVGAQANTWQKEPAVETARRRAKYRIPVAGYRQTSGVALTDAELRVIGWYLTDGTLNQNTLAITQSTASAHIADLERALTEAGLAFGSHTVRAGTGSQFKRNYDQRIYTVPKFNARAEGGGGAGWYRLRDYLDKDLSPLLFELTAKQLGVLLEAIHWGDGSKEAHQLWTRRTYHITTGNQTFAERLQRLCIEHGFRCNLKRYKSPYYTKPRPKRPAAGSLEFLSSGRVSARLPNRQRIGTFATVKEAKAALADAVSALPHVEARTPAAVSDLLMRSRVRYAFTINIGLVSWRTVEGTYANRTSLKKDRVHRQPGRAERVWCVSNTWGTLVVRRFGCTAIVGNCEERLYKYGQDAKALVQYVIARGTGDELILRAVINKLDTFEKVIGPTGDRMKEDLSAKEQKRGLDRLFEALTEMQAARPEPGRKARKSRGGKR